MFTDSSNTVKQSLIYAYDDQNRLLSVTDGVSATKICYAYDALGGLTQKISYQTGAEILRQQYSYDALGQTTGIANYRGTSLLSAESYTYDRAGNRLTKSNGATTTAYTYDRMNRLTAEVETNAATQAIIRSECYTFDRFGNRATKLAHALDLFSLAAYTYDVNNQLTSEAVSTSTTNVVENMTADATKHKTYSYDANGNQTNITTLTQVKNFAYDSMNRLSSAVVIDDPANRFPPTVTTTYGYNAAGQRIRKSSSGTVPVSLTQYNNGTSVVYDEKTTFGSGGATIERKTYLFGREQADGYSQFEASFDGTTAYIAMQDAHSDTTDLINATTLADHKYQYDAYGNEVVTPSGVANPFRYCSQYFDEETGLYYLRARYYDPSNGRFTQADSYLGEESNPLTLNLYGYCWGNPVELWDLSGRISIFGFNSSDFKSDWAGREILWHYLFGNGKKFVKTDSKWANYIMNAMMCTCSSQHRPYKKQTLQNYVKEVCGGKIRKIYYRQTAKIKFKVEAALQNGEGIKGYNYLHGTNGGLELSLYMERSKKRVSCQVSCIWNDVINPNLYYSSDKKKADFAKKIPFAKPTDYHLKICWKQQWSIIERHYSNLFWAE